MTPNDVLDATTEAELKAYEAQLRAELGLEQENHEHFARPAERPFLRQTRESTTVLFGGLTVAHDQLIEEAVRGLGYKVQALACPDNDALTIGKEFGNRGQCNPTYYTVGNLVKTLQNLRDEKGLTPQQINEQYVFLTAGACGPCRFGMYEAEYRKALTDSGFEGFRVLLFEQDNGISQAAGDQAADQGGIDYNKDFFMSLIKALMMGDLLNDLGYQVRPYEVKTGETDRVLEQSKRIVGEALRNKHKVEPALKQVRELFDAIECDFTRVKPKVKITGEFWAMTTEGDGNYKMGRWLESEGAHVLTEPVSTWVDYLLYIARHDTVQNFGLPGKDGKTSRYKQAKSWLLTGILKGYFRHTYDRYRKLLGMKAHALPDQGKLHKLAQKYYTIDLRGGEGHMEIGKNIYCVLEKKAHMVISVKPFGCMPSTQSDGVQSKVVNDYPECIFIPIETSGDGEVNIRSRVQMKLYEAKVRCREEFQRALDGYGLTMEQFREYVGSHRELRRALLNLPHEEVGDAANLLHMVAKRMKQHFSRRVDARMTVEQVEALAREEAVAEHAACAAEAAHEHEHSHEHSEGGCCGSGCDDCTDLVPGEQKQRAPEATAAATGGCGSGSCGCK
ncbi:MAG: 2-hydroxyglutaryl-CoA dehydratase [Planctomycetes bacterium]|nr:2-hydroxyglutaryl-CoA dehydratase [Planctomycetota bacterium]